MKYINISSKCPNYKEIALTWIILGYTPVFRITIKESAHNANGDTYNGAFFVELYWKNTLQVLFSMLYINLDRFYITVVFACNIGITIWALLNTLSEEPIKTPNGQQLVTLKFTFNKFIHFLFRWQTKIRLGSWKNY